MAIYPAAIPPSTLPPLSDPGVWTGAQLWAEVQAGLAELGVNPSGSEATVAALLLLKRDLARRVVAITDGATITIVVGTTDLATVTLGGNRTLAFSGTPTNGQQIELRVRQDATGGRTLTQPSSVNWSTDLPLTAIATAANAYTRFLYEYNSTTSEWDVLSVIRGH